MTTMPEIELPFDAASVIDLLARHPLPLAMNQIEVIEDGLIRFRPGDPLRFTFSFCGAEIGAFCTLGTEKMTVDLDAELGPLPYSVQSASARQRIIAMLHEQPAVSGRFELGSRNMIKFRGQVSVERPFTPEGLVTEMTAYMLEMMPQFEHLAEILAPTTRAAIGPAA